MRPGFVLLLFFLLPVTSSCKDTMQMKTIEEVKRANEARLLSLPDVTSVGIGRDEKGRTAIIVGLARENAETQRHIPSRIEDFPVVVNLSGPVKIQ